MFVLIFKAEFGGLCKVIVCRFGGYDTVGIAAIQQTFCDFHTCSLVLTNARDQDHFDHTCT